MTPTNQLVDDLFKDLSCQYFSWHAEDGKSWVDYCENVEPKELLDGILKAFQQLSDAKDAEWKDKVEEARREQIKKDAKLLSDDSNFNNPNAPVGTAFVREIISIYTKKILSQLNQK